MGPAGRIGSRNNRWVWAARRDVQLAVAFPVRAGDVIRYFTRG